MARDSEAPSSGAWREESTVTDNTDALQQLEWLRSLHERINTLAASTAKADRYALGGQLKAEITERITAAQQGAQVPQLPENETREMHDAVMEALYRGASARTRTNELWQAYRSVLLSASPQAPAQPEPSDRWYGAEEWMPLAWELCADECGEEACNELVWEGGAVPEPWGERWLKYEDEAKRLIALVRKHVPAAAPAVPASPQAPAQQGAQVPQQLTDEQIDRIAENCAKAMPDGIQGFCKMWGWRQFARELLEVCAGHVRASPRVPQGWLALEITADEAGRQLARKLFALGESGGARCPRIVFKIGHYPDNERDGGGFAEKPLAEFLARELTRLEQLARNMPALSASPQAPAQAESGNTPYDEGPFTIAAQQGAQVPQGWKLVPVEPTPAIMEAYMHAFVSEKRFDMREVWAAMLSASPQAPAQSESGNTPYDEGPFTIAAPAAQAEQHPMTHLKHIGCVPAGMQSDPGIAALARMAQSIGTFKDGKRVIAVWDHAAMFDVRDRICELLTAPPQRAVEPPDFGEVWKVLVRYGVPVAGRREVHELWARAVARQEGTG